MSTADDISAALDRAGAGTLTEGPTEWLLGRVARYSELAGEANNPGGLKCAARAPHDAHACVMRDSVAYARFPSLDEGAKALVQTAQRAGVRVGEAAAPDIEPLDERVKVGWIPGLGPSDEEEAKYRSLRADWEAFEREGVGTRILTHRKTDLDEWHKFRNAWEASDSTAATVATTAALLNPITAIVTAPAAIAAQPIGPTEITSRLNAQIMIANMIRRELVERKTGVDPGTSADRKNVDPEEHHSTATAVERWVKDSPLLDALTNPAGIKAERVLRAIFNPFANPNGKLNWTPVVLAGGVGLLVLLRRPTVIVTGARQ